MTLDSVGQHNLVQQKKTQKRNNLTLRKITKAGCSTRTLNLTTK